ncbi:hypothetical protein ACFL0V_03170 [Nanoarchaeota archaeon]
MAGQHPESFADIIFAVINFRPALAYPHVWRGHFKRDLTGRYQRTLFNYLLSQGFRRTPLQLVFPKQTAGLIKTLESEDVDEAHVRFYSDGVISCELEQGRYGEYHFSGERQCGNHYLEQIITESDLLPSDMEGVRAQLAERDYSHLCKLDRSDPKVRKMADLLDLSVIVGTVMVAMYIWQYGVGQLIFGDYDKLIESAYVTMDLSLPD